MSARVPPSIDAFRQDDAMTFQTLTSLPDALRTGLRAGPYSYL